MVPKLTSPRRYLAVNSALSAFCWRCSVELRHDFVCQPYTEITQPFPSSELALNQSAPDLQRSQDWFHSGISRCCLKSATWLGMNPADRNPALLADRLSLTMETFAAPAQARNALVRYIHAHKFHPLSLANPAMTRSPRTYSDLKGSKLIPSSASDPCQSALTRNYRGLAILGGGFPPEITPPARFEWRQDAF